MNFRANKGIYSKGQDNGVLSYPSARLANTDQRQLNKQEGTLQNVGQLELNDMSSANYSNYPPRASGHDSYNTGLLGTPIGRLTNDIHITDIKPNIVRNKDGSLINRDNLESVDMRKLQMMKPITGLLSHELLMQMEKLGKFK